MKKNTIPPPVRQYAKVTGLPGISLMAADNAEYGAVYELYEITKPGQLPTPTGMPVVLSYKDGICTPLTADEAFALLGLLGE